MESMTATKKSILADENKCTGCGACFSVCPKGAISFQEDYEGFLQPIVDSEKCINCSLCVKTCPALNYRPVTHEVETYASINRNNRIREESSSGGMFSLFAEDCIRKGGVVFGAKINEDFSICHSYTETIEGLSVFRGSKYVQSSIEDSFKECKKFLEDGRFVLFSASPCQISALKSFLKKDYQNLLTIDFVCHGVPNKKLLSSYIKYQEIQAGSEIRRLAFRQKTNGWKQFSVELDFANGITYCQPQTKDIWMLTFNKNIMLRKSCYTCPYKTKARISDVTLADLWGIGRVAPELDDDKGTSLMLIQSEKARSIFEKLKQEAIYKKIDFDAIEDCNSFHQTELHLNRDNFIEICLKKGFNVAYEKYVAEKGPILIYRFVRRILGKIKRKLFKLLNIKEKQTIEVIVDKLLRTGQNVE